MKNTKISITTCNTSEAPRKGKARDITFYLDQIRQKYGLEFDKLEAICTDGEIKPQYPYQWIAKTKIREGEDDPFEGIGKSPFEAIWMLWKNVKVGWENDDEIEEDLI